MFNKLPMSKKSMVVMLSQKTLITFRSGCGLVSQRMSSNQAMPVSGVEGQRTQGPLLREVRGNQSFPSTAMSDEIPLLEQLLVYRGKNQRDKGCFLSQNTPQ